MNYYDLDGIQTEIKKQIERTKCLIEKWEKVTYPTKKDGAPFKNMSKNFDGATYTAKIIVQNYQSVDGLSSAVMNTTLFFATKQNTRIGNIYLFFMT